VRAAGDEGYVFPGSSQEPTEIATRPSGTYYRDAHSQRFGDRVSMVVLLCAVCSVGKRSAELLHPFISNVRTLLPGQGQRITQMNDLSKLIQGTSQDATSTHSGEEL
jgi:hypothetical protein